ncbi:MAG TPA: terminase small subunit [Candidatus Omnitrophota bacterium]|nr:terminase small subunit [Candidatus Omnitrophota bacterium]
MEEETKKESIFNKLNNRQKEFVLEYLDCRVAAEAYRRVYDRGKKKKTEGVVRAGGAEILSNPNVKAAVAEKLNELWDDKEVRIGAIFDELQALAFSDVRKVMDFREDGTFSVKDLSGVDTRSIKKLKIRKEPSRKEGEEIIEGADIIEIELYDKRGALADLAEIVNMKKGITVNPQTIIYMDRQDEKL